MSTMDVDTHPNPQPNPHHRKIDLQSPHDLVYLQNNLAQSALQKLDLHFPKISKPATHISLGNSRASQPLTKDNSHNNDVNEDEEEEDPMRRRVHDLVSAFLTNTWRSAGHNVSVNGIDASTLPIPHTASLTSAPTTNKSIPSTNDNNPVEPKPETEGVDFQYTAFDASLQHKLAALHGELESLTAQVSKLRRTAPLQGAEAYQAKLSAALEADDAQYERELVEEKDTHVPGLQINRVRAGWNEDVKDIYERGIEELAGLAGSRQPRDDGVEDVSRNAMAARRGPTLTETVGKAQRATRVAMEMD